MNQKINIYNNIKDKLLNDESYSKIRDYSKERHRVITYFEVGKLLSKAGKHYGKDVIGKYSEQLIKEVGKKYNKRTLFRMKQFYEVFSDEKVSPLVTQLTWTHCLILLSLKSTEQINYYIRQTINRNLSKRQLENIIRTKEYERLSVSTKEKLKKIKKYHW